MGKEGKGGRRMKKWKVVRGGNLLGIVVLKFSFVYFYMMVVRICFVVFGLRFDIWL